MILLASVCFKIALAVFQIAVVGQTSILAHCEAVHSNGIFIFSFMPGFTLAVLLLERFRHLNNFLKTEFNRKRLQTDFKQTHALVYELFDILDLMGQSLGPQMLTTELVLCITGIFSVFSGFEVYFLRKLEYENTFVTLLLYNIPDIFDFWATCWLMSLIEKEV